MVENVSQSRTKKSFKQDSTEVGYIIYDTLHFNLLISQ